MSTPVVNAFRPEFLDFERGIRVGNLEPQQRITQILKLSLETRYGQPFVIDRWGRGVYWQWICFLPKANRIAKPISGSVNFGCSKFFIMIDREESQFKAGLQIERGYVKAPREYRNCKLSKDWDWHRFVTALRQKPFVHRELRRLVLRENFKVLAGSWEHPQCFDRSNFPSQNSLLKALSSAPENEWCGFQVYYPMTPREVEGSAGSDLIEAMLAVFVEVTDLMNSCMQIRLATDGSKVE